VYELRAKKRHVSDCQNGKRLNLPA